jgi:hypothetical protein
MPCETPTMPPKKAKKSAKRTTDRHRSGFMLRLPENHRLALEELRKKNRRTFTEEVQIALEKHYKDEGVRLPPAVG